MKRAVKPDAIVEIATGEATERAGGGADIRGWDYGVVMLRGSDGQWHEHPQYRGQHKRFLIELLSDSLRFNFQSHLACYTGKTPFCFRAHRGHDAIGVARRRDDRGGTFFCECDPDRCPLRQNHEEPNSRTAEILKYWGRPKNEQAGDNGAPYHYGNLIIRTREKGVPVIRGAACKPYNFFLFNLLLPDGQTYAHPEGEFAMLATHSEVTHGRIQAKLEQLCVRCGIVPGGGRLTGLRLWLEYAPVMNRYGKSSHAWRLEVPDGTDFEAMRAQAGQRAKLAQIDYRELPQAVLDSTCTALVAQHGARDIALLAATENDAVRQVQNAVDQLQVDASYIPAGSIYLINQDSLVQQLIRRIGISYARETAFPMMFGTDMRRCLDWLRATAAETKVDIDDLLTPLIVEQKSTHVELPSTPPAPAAEPVDAEYEVLPDAAVDAAVRGRSTFDLDPLTKTPEELAEMEKGG